MTKLLGRLLLALLIPATCFSQTPTGTELLSAINAQSDLWTHGKPFHLEADFVTQLQKPETGHLTWKWSASDLWQQEISLGAYNQTSVRKGGDRKSVG